MDVSVRYWRLEFTEGTSNKFYEVWLNEIDCEIILSWGRKNTEGQTDRKLFPNAEDAKAKALAQVYAKQSKGYHIVHEDLVIPYDTRDNVWGRPNVLRRATVGAIRSGEASPREAALNYIEGFITDCNAFLAKARDGTVDEESFEDLSVRWKELADKFDSAETMMTMVKRRTLKHA